MDQTKQGGIKGIKVSFCSKDPKSNNGHAEWGGLSLTKGHEKDGGLLGNARPVRSQVCDVATEKLVLSGYINRDISYRTEEVSDTFCVS